MELYEYNAFELSKMLESRKISSAELTQAVLERAEKLDNKLNAYITICADNAFEQAKAVDNKRSKGESLSPLAGIPIAVKDNISVKDVKMTCGSKMLENYISPYNATVIEKLEAAGAVIVGKLNMDEFAMGSSTEHSVFGAVHNPYDLAKVSGGSSGGCAAAVRAGETVLALGSDTGGSIRQPASFCGVVGLKPTYGSVSRYGLTAFASSFDQIGPVCRCVKDTALLFDAVRGHDSRDSTSVNIRYSNTFTELDGNIRGVKIGVPREIFEDRTQPDVLECFNDALRTLESCEEEIVEIKLENTEYALPAYYVISSAEASSNLARFDGVRYGFRAVNANDPDEMFKRTRSKGFGDECKRRIMLGNFVLSEGYYDSYYINAKKAAKLIKRSIKEKFSEINLIAMPTCPETAFDLGEKREDPVAMYNSDIFTVFANLTGMPAISIPCGFGKGSLPVGLQLIGDSFCEQGILDAAFAFESVVGISALPKL